MTKLLAARDTAPIYARAQAARAAYEDAVDSDGVTHTAWWRIAGEMRAAVDGLRGIPGVLLGPVECLEARARDAEQRAQFCERMLAVAKMSRKQIIEVVA